MKDDTTPKTDKHGSETAHGATSELRSTGWLECARCGGTEQRETEIKAMGRPWKIFVSCEICGIASAGWSREEAALNFEEGRYDLEAAL